LAASNVIDEGIKTNSRVAVTGGVVIECIKTKGRIPNARGTLEQSVQSLGRVATRISAVWCWDNGVCALQKRNAGQHE
jgi:hypothetical protein